MIPEKLSPKMELLRQEYVLIQAWKKTSSYIRYHNWFSDTLALDRAAATLPHFISGLRERLKSPKNWKKEPLRIVPAPKSQPWSIQKDGWKPVKKRQDSVGLRPLAHVSLSDQVVATAILLCLANRVETLQGDPRWSIATEQARKQVISYGNRLFCDEIGDELQHRWGSTRLYRAYFQDYRSFVARPVTAAESIDTDEEMQIYIVHADLKQFYDRVHPKLVAEAILGLQQDGDDSSFFEFASSFFQWCWNSKDQSEVQRYRRQAKIVDFDSVALPQGLVAAGFFANLVLLPFDKLLIESIGTQIATGIALVDICRYVDDLRVVVSVEPQSSNSFPSVEEAVSKWLAGVLDEKAPGLALSEEKTQIAAFGSNERPLIRQSLKMERIQSAVSGGFDALGGEEILDAIQGLIATQQSSGEDEEWRLAPIPDVRDETVARFGAVRYRKTVRSIRPLLLDTDPIEISQEEPTDATPFGRLRATRTRHELDEETRVFALGLVKRWVEDPSNVRLLRIGLDMWPDSEVLEEILSLLRPFATRGGPQGAPRRVAWYCLAEILRAGATETGYVGDTESLPSVLDLHSYREILGNEAERLINLGRSIPWFLRQQALLFLAVHSPTQAPVYRSGSTPELLHYRELILFLQGKELRQQNFELATLAIVARRAFTNRTRAVELVLPFLNSCRTDQIAQNDPAFLLEIIGHETGSQSLDSRANRFHKELERTQRSSGGKSICLAEAVLQGGPVNPLRNELSLLRFAMAFVEERKQDLFPPDVITPSQIKVELNTDGGVANVQNLQILDDPISEFSFLYQVPDWCDVENSWRFQLGFLLRFILSRHPDYTRCVRQSSWNDSERSYRPAESHWYQRSYGLYNGQSAFGDDWLPISDWTEGFLHALLRWPGCRATEEFEWIEKSIEIAEQQIRKRKDKLEQHVGNATGTLFLPMRTKQPKSETMNGSLRACVVQTSFPTDNDFSKDLMLNRPDMRRLHRDHLSAALAAVKQTLVLRETHKRMGGNLDWLILPELAVHPKDVQTHLIPFARDHKTLILAGLTYQEIYSGFAPVNSALWIIPERTDTGGLQITTRRQGKAHLSPEEQKIETNGKCALRGFRPCQWLIGYPWSKKSDVPSVWMSAAVCYDATDLGLAADLKDRSDVLAIPALNKDVKTFDQMALALHYHMFQLVIVANNGQYGGSSAYWPKSGSFNRQVFHFYGQPQASIAFLEIDDIENFLNRHSTAENSTSEWKHAPANSRFASNNETR